MAYNPFRTFRKHQKKLFAGLTILCMITFVMTGSMVAGRDFFQGLMLMFGAGGRGPEVATLYGKRVQREELVRLQEQRQIANRFMFAALSTASRNAAQQALQELGQSKLDKQILSEVQNYFLYGQQFLS